MRIKTDTRRQGIVEAATQAFLENGFDKTSMQDIANRFGGSKATLYGYFSSKEALFLEVMHRLCEEHFGAAFAKFRSGKNIREALCAIGIPMVQTMCSDTAVAMYRLIVSKTADPTVGRLIFSQGPSKGDETMATLLQLAMDEGLLRVADPEIAGDHLRSLFESEFVMKRLFSVIEQPSEAQIQAAVGRAVDVFLAAYEMQVR